MPADKCSQTHVDEGATGPTHVHRTPARSTVRLQHTRLAAPSSHLPLRQHIHMTGLLSLPPFYSSIQSSLRLPPTARLKWLIKDPKHLGVDIFVCLYTDVLSRHSASLHLVSHLLLELSPLWDLGCHTSLIFLFHWLLLLADLW